MNNRQLSASCGHRTSSPSTLVLGYRDAVAALRAADIATPELDARLLVCHACGVNSETFFAHPDRELGVGEQELLSRFIDRRRAREPVSRILGSREFWGLEFAVSPDTLDPRPDSETLVRAALDVVHDAGDDTPPSILDLGTGSGCLLIALLDELKSAIGTGVDISERALHVAKKNAIRHGVDTRAEFLRGSWSAASAHEFDLVVANPPYIPSGDIPRLEPEVRDFDPSRALNGGRDGLDAYRAIVPVLSDCLAPGGWVLFEVGADQAASVNEILASHERGPVFGEFRQWLDLSDRMRCVGARRSPTL